MICKSLTQFFSFRKFCVQGFGRNIWKCLVIFLCLERNTDSIFKDFSFQQTLIRGVFIYIYIYIYEMNIYIYIYYIYIYIYMPIITWYTNLVWQKKLHSYVTMIHSNSKISIQSLNLGKSKTLIILLFFINFMLLYYFNASLFHFSLLNS